MAKIAIHQSVTDTRVMRLVKDQMFGLDNPGICLACGADHDACEPDARRYQCYECEKRTVFGAAEILLLGAYHSTPESANAD